MDRDEAASRESPSDPLAALHTEKHPLMPSIFVLTLFASWPFLSFLATNQEQTVYHQSILLAWGLFLLLVFAVLGAARLVLRGSPLSRPAVLIAVCSLMFFSFGSLSKLLLGFGVELGVVRLSIWLVLFLVAAALAWRLSVRPGTVRVLVVVSLALVAMPMVQLGLFLLKPAAEEKAETVGMTRAASAARQPNVYWLVMDGYTRNDILKANLGYDNAVFVEELNRRGFIVPTKSYSNYGSTSLSISTTVTMNYYLPAEGRHSSMWDSKITGSNNVVRRFKRLGYYYIHAGFGGGSYKSRCGGIEDRCIVAPPTGLLSLDQAQVNLLRLTPLFRVVRRLWRDLIRFDYLFVSDLVDNLPNNKLVPFYLFAHILSPHPPARYAQDCSRLPEMSSVITAGAGSRVEYIHDLKCLNRNLLNLIDHIQETDGSDPIILIQGDHGYRYYGLATDPAAGGTKNQLRRARYAIFNAFRLPADCRDHIYNSISPVNTFRVVFACIEGRAPKLLPDRFYGHDETRLFELNLD